METTVTYHDTIVDQGRGNPCIEALNPVISDTELTKKLLRKPAFKRPDINLPSHLRRQSLAIIEEVYTPLPHVLRLGRSVDDTMRCGLMNRNPMAIGYWNEDAKQWQPRVRSIGHQPITGINFGGEGGLGKTITVKNLLGQQQQVIRHTTYKPACYAEAKRMPGLEHLKESQPFPHVQLTYLFVECSPSYAPTAMAQAIFTAADEALGNTDYTTRYGKGNLPTLERNAFRLARNHSLGILVVDEVQRIIACKSTINFLISLNNVMKVPIMFVGTKESIAMFESDPSLARRGNKMGDHKWERMDWNKEEGKKSWTLLMKTLWPYQVLRDIGDLTDEICKEFWEGSKGIPDYGVKLFRAAQCRALDSKIENLTPEVIRSACDGTNFSRLLLDKPEEHEKRYGAKRR